MNPIVRRRPTAQLNLAPAGCVILAAIVMAAKATGLTLEITCGSDGHPPTDPHTTGEAIDVAAATLTASQVLAVKSALELALHTLASAPFTVLYECATLPTDSRLASVAYLNPQATGPHFHMQRQIHTVYPPKA